MSDHTGGSGMHDFDFLVGHWHVKHRRLKHRLARANEWQTFTGTMTARPYLGGQAIVDDNVLDLEASPHRAITLRAFDPPTGKWSIWWLDSRRPAALDPPLVGEFEQGIGTFFAHDSFAGQPILVRFIWSEITARSARWEQAFSADNGHSWEVNWVMEFERSDAL